MTVQRRRSSVWVWPCLLLLILGAALRWPTLGPQENYLRDASARLAYSDIVDFWKGGQNPLPYLQRQLEYPVLTGPTLWLTKFAPGGQRGYFLANAAVLSAALLTCFVLLRRAGPGVRLPFFALAPGLAFYGTLNWDALGVVGLVAAIVFARRGHFGRAGVSVALGASAKLFPLYILPVLWAHAVVQAGSGAAPGDGRGLARRLVGPAPLRLLGGFLAAALVVNLPVLLRTPAGWSYFLRFQAERTHNPDSIWAHLPPVHDQVQTAVFAQVFLFGVLWLTARVLRGARWEMAAMLSVLLFLLPTKVYSPQYDLWLLPFLALLAPPVWLWLAFVVADAFYYWAIFHFYALLAGGVTGTAREGAAGLLSLSVWWREAVLALLFVWGLTRLRGAAEPPGFLARLLDRRDGHARELRRLRLAVGELRAEVAALRAAGPPAGNDETPAPRDEEGVAELSARRE